MRLLIAEDERELSEALVTIFERHNYSVDAVYNGADALDYGLYGNYDGIILDIMMPKMNGLDVLIALREGGVGAPMMLLTAKSEVGDRISGFDSGADDYLPKPFAVSELLARVRAMLRRKGDFTPDILDYEGLTLNRATFELAYGGEAVRLGGREYQVMEMLIENPRHIISTAQFMDKIWGWASESDVSVVWVNVSNLRKRLAAIKAPFELRAARGAGYSLEAAK